jgi:hypothetical protein
MFLEQRLSNPKWAHSYSGMFWNSMVFYGGSPPSPPPAPPPPDYAAANRAGVLADVQTLGSRKAIEQAAKLGGTALGFGIQEKTESRLKEGYSKTPYQFQTGTTTQKDRNGRTTTVPVYETRYRYTDSAGNNVSKDSAFAPTTTYYQSFDADGKRLGTPREVSKQEAVIDFAGKSDIDVAKSQAEFQRAEQKVNAQSQLDLQKEYGTQFATEARNQLQAIDPTGYANRELLGKKVAETQFEGVTDGPTFKENKSGPTLEMAKEGPALSRQAYGPEFQSGDANAGGGTAAAGRAEIERQLGENLFNNGKLTDEQARRLNNSVRGAQTARGNIYGNAPTAQEILTRSGAEQDMARQARSDVVGYLQSGQSSYDIANAIRQESNQLAQQGYLNYSTANSVNNSLAQQEFQNQQTALGQRNQAQQSMYQNELSANTANNQLAQQAYGNQLAGVQQRNAATQQGIANLQSYAGLQPIVTQGGQLGALGQGAAPTIQTPIPQGVNINPNAGKNSQDFALGVYGNQTSQYNAQLGYLSSTYATSQKNSPLSWITGIGGVLF